MTKLTVSWYSKIMNLAFLTAGLIAGIGALTMLYVARRQARRSKTE